MKKDKKVEFFIREYENGKVDLIAIDEEKNEFRPCYYDGFTGDYEPLSLEEL